MPERQQTRTILIDNRYNARERVAIGQEIVSFIKLRTSLGINRTNNLFPAYSSNYDKENKGVVNLKDNGDMLNSLQVLNHSAGRITIGYKARTKQNDKASYNQSTGPGPDRTFIGIMPGDLNGILQKFPLGQDRRFPGLISVAIAAAALASVDGEDN